MSAQFPNCQVAIVPATAAAIVGIAGQRILRKVVIGGATANATVQFKNAATDTGDVLLTLSCLANDSKEFSFDDVGGIVFSTAMYCKPAGTGAIAYVWYD
jgi:hypothetical protein